MSGEAGECNVVNSTKCFEGTSRIRTERITGFFDMEDLSGPQDSGPCGGMGAEVRSERNRAAQCWQFFHDVSFEERR